MPMKADELCTNFARVRRITRITQNFKPMEPKTAQLDSCAVRRVSPARLASVSDRDWFESAIRWV
jgi:hypothetical protein